MPPATPDDDLPATLARQEEECAFAAFDERVAWAIGLALCEAARVRSAPVVIDIRTPDRTLFHAALPGSTPHNGDWARRKSNVTLRFQQSSMRVGEAFRLKGKTIGAAIGLDEMDYAAHGGSFPIRVRGTGGDRRNHLFRPALGGGSRADRRGDRGASRVGDRRERIERCRGRGPKTTTSSYRSGSMQPDS